MRASLRPSRKTSTQRAWRKGISSFLIPAICLLSSVLIGCSPQQKHPTEPQDKPLAAFQTNLLQTAFDFATAIPAVPHIKDRSRVQEEVVTACFELDQPQRALTYVEQIKNWRKGSGYADYAFYCVQNDLAVDVDFYLNLAEEIASLADQQWRKDTIRVKAASVRTLLRDPAAAERLVRDVEPASQGKLKAVQSRMMDSATFDAQVDELERLFETKNFDVMRNALETYTHLYRRWYGQPDRRERAEQAVRGHWDVMPVFVRVELLMNLCDAALSQTDRPEALRLLNDADSLMDSVQWKAEHHIPLISRLAALRFRCGESEKASAELSRALTLLSEQQNKIINIYKAETLIPTAEAYGIAGDGAASVAVYKQAVEAAVENPNSRPRAEDLSAICLSMAVQGVEPDEALWKRIKEIQANLGDPW